MKAKAFEILIIMAVLFALATLVSCKDEAEAMEPNIIAIDLNSKCVCLQFSIPDVNNVNEAVSLIRRQFFCEIEGREVIDIEVIIGNETHTASFEDFFEWMGFKEPNELLIDSEIKEFVLEFIKGVIRDFQKQGYTLDPNAANEGRIEFIEPKKDIKNILEIKRSGTGFIDTLPGWKSIANW